jgi:hypothetical protein
MRETAVFHRGLAIKYELKSLRPQEARHGG